MSNKSDSEDRLIGLEALRFLAAISVLVWHFQHFAFAGNELALSLKSVPFRWLFQPFYNYGYTGVQLFWCISGFIFTWKYGAAIAGAGVSFRRFAMLRFSRLYPLHLATLLIVLVLQWVYFSRYGEYFVYKFNSAGDFVANLLFLNWWNYLAGDSFNGPAWSVAAEVFVYCVFFLVGRCAGSNWRVDLLMLFAFIIGGFAASALCPEMLAFVDAGRFFYFGALSCHVWRWAETLRPGTRPFVAFGFAAFAALYMTLVAVKVLDVSFAIQSVFPAALIAVQLAVRPRGALIRRALIGLGNLTYASYMVHFPMQLAAVLVLGALAVPVQPLLASPWFMLGYLASVLAVAAVVFRWVERPAQDWLRGRDRPWRSLLSVAVASRVPAPGVRSGS
jgi:peptidoglycan/LPS O-acetylase OafA/YrhL